MAFGRRVPISKDSSKARRGLSEASRRWCGAWRNALEEIDPSALRCAARAASARKRSIYFSVGLSSVVIVLYHALGILGEGMRGSGY